jgi:hypothetical protein
VLKDAEPEELFGALLGAAGLGSGDRAALRQPEPDVSTNLDARTVWALLRALAEQPGGLTPEDAAANAVLPVAIAVRYLQRLTARKPALVSRAIESAPAGRYTLTAAGAREIARLERRIPGDAAPQAI